MKTTTWRNWFCKAAFGTAIIGFLFVLMASVDVEGASGRGARIRGPDPNKPVPIDNPFIGVVVSASSTSITVEGKRGRDNSKRGQRDQNADPEGNVHIRFTISGDCKIARDGKIITAADIKKDEQVRVMFTAKEGSIQRHATEIQLGQVAAEARKDQQEKGKGGGKKAKK